MGQPEVTPIDLALTEAKSIRRRVDVLVQQLARIRDATNPQPQEAQDVRPERTAE